MQAKSVQALTLVSAFAGLGDLLAGVVSDNTAFEVARDDRLEVGEPEPANSSGGHESVRDAVDPGGCGVVAVRKGGTVIEPFIGRCSSNFVGSGVSERAPDVGG